MALTISKLLDVVVKFFLSLIFLYGFLILLIIYIPLAASNSYESNPIDVISVRSNIYLRNQSEQYPIGALQYGSQTVLLVNRSNEKIRSNFVLKIQNMSEKPVKVNGFVENYSVAELFLGKGTEERLVVPFEVLPHNQIFVEIIIPDETSPGMPLYPISVLGWSFKN